MSGQDMALLRAVERGGMIVLRAGRCDVYRSQDARRGVAGRLPSAQVKVLIDEGKLCAQRGDEGRLVAPVGARLALTEDAGRPAPCLPVLARKRRKGSLLEKILSGEQDGWQREYLARAAWRFLGAVESVNAGQTITMNWSFVPKGKAPGLPAGREGHVGAGLAAQRSLDQLNTHLGPRDMKVLRMILVGPSTLIAIAGEFDVPVRRAAAEGLNVLCRLARAYDQLIAPEACQTSV